MKERCAIDARLLMAASTAALFTAHGAWAQRVVLADNETVLAQYPGAQGAPSAQPAPLQARPSQTAEPRQLGPLLDPGAPGQPQSQSSPQQSGRAATALGQPATLSAIPAGALWNAVVVVDGYHGTASGGFINTPYERGTHHSVSAQFDWSAPAVGGSTFATGAWTQSDDRASLEQRNTLIRSIQGGALGERYSLVVGDIQPVYSVLGTASGLRGLMGQRVLDTVVVSAAVGTVAPSWETLTHAAPRTQYLRDAAAFKLESWFTPTLSGFVTIQGYADRKSSFDDPTGDAATGRVQTGTAGFNFRDTASGSLRRLTGEFARSRFTPDRGNISTGNGVVLDGQLQWVAGGLRAGYHKVDANYTSLSVQAPAGVEDAYLGGDWRPFSWGSMSADLRHSKDAFSTYVNAMPVIAVRTTDAYIVSANASLASWLRGVGVQAQRYAATLRTPALSEARQSNDSIGLTFNTLPWTAALTYNRLHNADRFAPQGDATTTNWNAHASTLFGASPGSGAGGVSGNVNISICLSRQAPATAPENLSRMAAVGVSLQNSDRWSLNASFSQTQTEQAQTGLRFTQRNAFADVARQFTPTLSAKLYARLDRSDANSLPLAHKAAQIGIQLATSFR